MLIKKGMHKTMTRMPVLFVGHGSPMNAIEDNSYTREWKSIAERIPTPEVILSVSAHWYGRGTKIMNEENPKTIYDMYGFPKELYEVKYNTSGSPEIAEISKELIGSKWKLLIMQNLLSRAWRFNELRKSLEGISQKVLTDSLRSMEADGIIIRTVYPEVPPRVEYALSDLGESMRPIISAMEAWGSNYKENYEIK